MRKTVCCDDDSIIIFSYVDDIFVTFKLQKQTQALELREQLKKQSKLTGGHDLQWLLGVDIIRDLRNRYLWFSLQAYIRTISRLLPAGQP